MRELTTPERLFAELVASEPARPFVTYYDEASGERSELSVRSLANWVAKTHFLLIDELGLGVGDTAVIDLPAHWISVPVLLGCLSAGLALSADGSGAVAFVGPGTGAVDGAVDVADSGAVDAPDVFAISASSAAVGFRDAPPAGAQDYVAAVRPQGDTWAAVRSPAGPDDPCLPGLTRASVAAERGGLGDGARVLWTHPWTGPADWRASLFEPLAAGGSIVYVANCTDEAVLERRAAQERVTDRR